MKKTSFFLALAALLATVCCGCLLPNEEIPPAGGGDTVTDGGNNDGGNNDGGNNGGGNNDGVFTHTYTDFTAMEKETLTTLFGETIPFLPNDEYEFSAYSEGGETGVHFYTIGNTQAEFNAYRNAFSAYTYLGEEEDADGDTWYYYGNDDYYVDLSIYEWDGDYVVDVYAYFLTSGGNDDQGGGSGGNDDNDGNDGNDSNDGNDEGGVVSVDFTQATHVKDVHDQGYYLDGCPTVGKPGVLVIPVEFSDVTAESKGYEISTLKQAFKKGGNTDYYSVYDYYYTSSYGVLDLNITVLDTWFKPKYSSTYYKNLTTEYYDEQVAIGDQVIMDEALAYLESRMDLSSFDSDKNGVIDAVVLINTLDIDSDSDFNWAYRYWNIYTDSQDYYYEYDGVSANDYLWASYQFLYEDSKGGYADTNGVNTYTYIHEFGHVLGADDYYDTAYVGEPMGGYDVMDSMAGDHNAYTKFNYGWLTTSRLVTTNSSVTLSLEAFSKNGDTIILANDWDSTLGAYQEYYIVVYYTNDGLNSGAGGYFNRDGIVVYHVNASLYTEKVGGVTYYDVQNNNTDPSNEYGTTDNLIEYVLNGKDTYTYKKGDSLGTTKLDDGTTLGYTFTVDSISDDTATLTFTKC